METLLLTIPEVAQQLRQGESTVRRAVISGEIASVKLGRSRRIPRAALEEYITRLVAESAKPAR